MRDWQPVALRMRLTYRRSVASSGGPSRSGAVSNIPTSAVSGALWDHRSADVWGCASVGRAAEQAFAQAGMHGNACVVTILSTQDRERA